MPDFQSATERGIIATARAAEIERNSSASGCTILKFRPTPIDDLATKWEIGMIELEAAKEYSAVFESIAADLRFVSPQQMFADKQTKVTDDRPPTDTEAEVWRRYRDFTNHWSNRRKQCGDRTLPIFVAAVIDQQPWEHIAADNCVSVKKAKSTVVRALRNYALRAGWVDQDTAKRWGMGQVIEFTRK